MNYPVRVISPHWNQVQLYFKTPTLLLLGGKVILTQYSEAPSQGIYSWTRECVREQLHAGNWKSGRVTGHHWQSMNLPLFKLHRWCAWIWSCWCLWVEVILERIFERKHTEQAKERIIRLCWRLLYYHKSIYSCQLSTPGPTSCLLSISSPLFHFPLSRGGILRIAWPPFLFPWLCYVYLVRICTF